MEKKVTKEEVERVLNLYICYTQRVDNILNELFPPEFKVGDWVVRIWPSGKETLGKAVFEHGDLYWKCEEEYKHEGGVSKGQPYGKISNYKGGWNGSKLRHATPEEIAAAEWEEGKEYRVWEDKMKLVRVSSSRVGYFYENGRYDGNDVRYSKYEKL